MLKYAMHLSLTLLLLASAVNALEDKIYINDEDIKATYDKFYIHQGDNIWLETNSLHRDSSGLFTLQTNLSILQNKGPNVEYVKKWRCPYCNHYWPIGQ